MDFILATPRRAIRPANAKYFHLFPQGLRSKTRYRMSETFILSIPPKVKPLLPIASILGVHGLTVTDFVR